MNRSRLAIISLLAAAGLAMAQPQTQPQNPAPVVPPPPVVPVAAAPRIDVVFVLDTTGSMSGLIEGAKQKIWSVANSIATAQPHPEIRMGLVAYRDRGDDYITRLTPLTSDLDAVYSDLMKFSAGGGGDGPESVNQALAEAVTKFEWSNDAKSLKLIYLVGDAPPHMDYEQDVLYAASCERAAKSGITINTIQCGGDTTTTPIWQEIARRSEGEFFQIDQNGGMLAVATPMDDELARLGAELGSTVIAYGSAEEQAAQNVRREKAREIEAKADSAALAERALYQSGPAAGRTLTGSQELVQDLADGKVKLENIPAEELSKEMQAMSADQRRVYVEEQSAKRQAVQAQINQLNEQRQEYLKKQIASTGDSFDAKVLQALRIQAARRGIQYR